MLRILIVRLSAIGDVLHATTVVHNLRQFLPDAELTWLVSPPASTMLEHNPDIDRLLIWDRRPTAKAGLRHPLTAGRELKKAQAVLAPYTFDVVLDIQGLFLTGLLSKMSGAPRRIGIHERHEGNPLFMTELAPDIASPHKIRRYLTALQPLGFDAKNFRPGIVLTLPPELADFAATFWPVHGIDPTRPLLMVNTRTTWPDKSWEPAAFGAALRDLPSEVQIVFSGAPNDAPYIAEARAVLGDVPNKVISIAGETSLMELAALFRSATLLLTGDTGPLYIAEGVGLPTLSLWGPTSPDIYGPLTSGHTFILSPHSCTACCKTRCQHHTNACMRAIQPDIVHAKLCELLEQLKRNRQVCFNKKPM